MYRTITAFKTYLEQQGTKQHTVNAYSHDLYQWVMYCMEHNIYDIEQIKQQHIDMYIRHLQELCITRSTAQRKCASLRHFTQFCALPIEIPTLSNTIDIFSSDADIKAICSYLLACNDPFKRRDGHLIQIMYELELSYTTVAPLRTYQITWNGKKASVIHDQRVSNEAAHHLAEYIEHNLPHIANANTNDLVFPYIRNNDPIVMPHHIYLHKLRHYRKSIQKRTQSLNTPFGQSHEHSGDTTLKERYLSYHERA